MKGKEHYIYFENDSNYCYAIRGEVIVAVYAKNKSAGNWIGSRYTRAAWKQNTVFLS
jgi:hypothetical protein